jgi:hypothetical protein
MTGGVDRGPCFSYWRLSYRRKFLRTVWMATAVLAFMIFFQVIGFPWKWGVPRDSDAEREQWLLIGLVAVLAGVQAGYNYLRWKRGRRSTA